MSLQPLCGGPNCAKVATSEMIDAGSKQFIAHVCSQACGVALIGMPKRAADDDDDARKRAAAREDPRELLAKQRRYSQALATCYQIYTLMNGIIDNANGPYGSYEYGRFQRAVAKTLTIGSDLTSAQDAQRRLAVLTGDLIAALGSMHAGLPYDDVDIDGQILAIRNGLADQMTLNAFDAITEHALLDDRVTYEPVIDDIRRMMAKRSLPIQILARTNSFRKLPFSDKFIEFGTDPTTNQQYIEIDNVYFDQALMEFSRSPYDFGAEQYSQSAIGELPTGAKIIHCRGIDMIDSWSLYPRAWASTYTGTTGTIDFTPRANVYEYAKWKTGKQILCVSRPGTDLTTEFVVFRVHGAEIIETSFSVPIPVQDYAIDSEGYVWMSIQKDRTRVAVYTHTGVDVGTLFLPYSSSTKIKLYWADREGVWIVGSAQTKPSDLQFFVNQMLRARVAP